MTMAVPPAAAVDGAAGATVSPPAAPPLLRVERLGKRFSVSGKRGSLLHALSGVPAAVCAP